jgi:nitrite reductase/ring-hydroxylating ferredoxin subunit
MTEHNLGKWHHVYDGHGKMFTINGKKVAMFMIEGKLFAFEDECPHVGASLATGKLEGKLVTCPAHYWQFDVTNGECVTLDLCDDGSFVETYPVKMENDEIILSLPS